MSNDIISVVEPLTPHDSTCGYCGPPGERSVEKSNRHAAELIPVQLSCMVYQRMIDRGWRRSGTYCYKPDLKRSCCKQYTIRLNALEFKPSKSQRKLINRFNRYVLHGDHDFAMDVDTSDSTQRLVSSSQQRKGKRREQEFSLTTDIHAPESRVLQKANPVHQFEVTLEHASYTEEKFQLFQMYQKEVHKEDEKLPSSFDRFLVHTPLQYEPIPYPGERPEHLPADYGSYHQMYRLDGELIAIGVIDILPHCVSSVYFLYNTKWSRFGLGKLSALREISLAKDIHDAGVPDMQFVYMGFYIHTCPKMRYKGEYSPSYLADPEDYTWHPLEKCRPLLDKYSYACFSHPEHSIEGMHGGPVEMPNIPSEELDEILLLDSVEGGNITVIPITMAPHWRLPWTQQAIKTVANGLGLPLAKELIYTM